jgi:hypothetical protein
VVIQPTKNGVGLFCFRLIQNKFPPLINKLIRKYL